SVIEGGGPRAAPDYPGRRWGRAGEVLGSSIRRRPVSGVRSCVAFAAAVLAGSGVLWGCGGGGGGVPTLTWYINPDNGGQQDLAAKCTKAADGDYRIDGALLPSDADGQREQLVRRLGADDSSIDIMSLDPVFVPEFANAGFLRPFSDKEAAVVTKDVLDGPSKTVEWDDRVVPAPFWPTPQRLGHRKSVAEQAGIDPTSGPVTWDQVIKAAEQTDTTVEVTGARYEGYMVLITALVLSAGGAVLKAPAAAQERFPEL